MYIVNGVLVSDELVDGYFCCDLNECKGMCCLDGDVGAPLSPDEIGDLEDAYPVFKKYLTDEGVDKIEKDGCFDYDMEGEFVTPLLADEACAFICYENGVAKCAIEKAFYEGEIDFPKPISCHLYPIRIKILPDYEALNYHKWHVCRNACENGKQKQIKIYRFLKNALIRKYGEEWYQELEKLVNS